MFRRSMILVFALLISVLIGSSSALAQKTISGTISTDTTLDTVGGSVYQVLSSVTVSSGVTLTIDPGVTLKFNPSTYLNVAGTLFAEGGSTPDSTIVFTSITDDAAPLGAGEDTNGDGAATTPAVGDWYYIQFEGVASSASTMRWCTVRYTGRSSYSTIYASNNAAPTIRACALSDGYRGVQIRTGASPLIRNTSINRMTLMPVYMSLNSSPVFDNIILDAPSGNATDAIQLYDGAVVGTLNLPRPSATIGGVPTNSLAYQVAAVITVGAGESMNIEPGVVLKFNSSTYIDNYGLLTAFGGATTDSLIYFTSIDDDNAPEPFGQDTNVNGNDTFPDWNDWGGIRFNDSSDDNSVLRNCRIQFAGQNTSTYGAVNCNNASPTLQNCDLTAGYYGLKCVGVSNPALRNSSINAMQDVPVAIEISANPTFDSIAFGSTSDNGFDAIGILGGTLSGVNTLGIRGATLGVTPIDNLVYILLSDIFIAEGGDLTIDPGIVAKPRDYVDVFVDGALHMDGTADPDSTIVFTSYKDDTYGNPADTNNDGSNTSPVTGNWGRIQFNPGSTGSVSHAVLKFGGYTSQALISADSASPDLHDLVLQNSYYGIEQAGTAASVISNVDISNTTFTPMLMSISADPVYSGITFTNVGLSAIGLIPEIVGVDSVLRVRSMAGFDNISYYLANNLTVATGAHFRLEPGVVIKFGTITTGVDLIIDGSLQAVSTPDSTTAFTSVYDDSRGNPGDTAGDGSATVPGQSNWGYIKFTPTSDDLASIIHLSDLAFGGRGYSSQPDGAIWCNSSSPTITENYFSTNYIGVWTDGNSAPLIQDNTFFNQVQTPLATSVLANPNYVNNTFNQNGIHAVGLINETLAADATLEKITTMGLPSYPYYNLGSTTVGIGTTLTIEPGVIIKARANTNVILVNGALQAAGTVGDRIILTSISDDSQGGDSNVDGAGSSPAAGDWHGIYFYDSADDLNCLVDQCLFRFAGRSYVLYMDAASPTITNNEFELCTYGIDIRNDSAPIIQNNLFRVLTWYPVVKSVLSQPTFGGNLLDNVTYECLGIRGENIGQDMTMQKWDFGGYTNITQALVGGALTVQLGATLTIEPGVVFKMLSQSYHPFSNAINVYGSLIADGTALDPIILTSVKDDTVGNPADTNGDGAGTSPALGNWASVYFDEVSDDATAILDHCELRYGYNSTNYGMVRCNSASPTISNSRFEYASYALSTRGDSSPTFDDCIVDEMSVAPVLMSLTSDPQFSGNQFLAGNAYNALGIIGETLAQDARIKAQDVGQVARIPYLLQGSLTAGFSSILRIDPGVIIKSSYYYYNITIQRGLIAEGGSSPDSLIVFTSATDDFYGGDTNNDGDATAPDAVRWGRIIIQNEAIDDSTRISNAVFRYGYNSSSLATLEINSANPEIDNCVFAYNGIAVDYKGIAGDPAEGWIHNSDFISNTYYGVRNQGTAFTVDATGNWWGHATGPLDNSDDTGSGGYYNPGGLGDPVSDKVNYGSWETTGVQNIVLGDVSRNGDVRAYDGSLVLQELVAPGLLGPLQEVLGDVDCSGGLMALDASLILRYVAGLDTYFPCALDSVPTKKQGDLPAYMTSQPVVFSVDLPQVSLDAGSTTWVPVQISGSGDVFGQEYHILFDPTQVSVANVRLLPEAEGSAMAWNVLNGNELRIAIASLEPLSVSDAVEFELVGANVLEELTPVDLMVAFARLNEEELANTSAVDDLPDPSATRLFQNHPNPFNPMTTIKYAVGSGKGDQPVRLTIFDARGHVVRELVNDRRGPGTYEVVWDSSDSAGRRVGSGLYLYKLDVGGQVLINKMLLLK
jgi:parallel beta-helix repeat protein